MRSRRLRVKGGQRILAARDFAGAVNIAWFARMQLDLCFPGRNASAWTTAIGARGGLAKTPKPNVTRLKSIVGHSVFGLGMYVTALMLKASVGHSAALAR